MAKTKPAEDLGAAAPATAVSTMAATTVAAPAATPITAAPVAASGATPENTPVPGGGRWRWDIALPGWVEIDDEGKPVPVAPPVADPAAATPASTSE